MRFSILARIICLSLLPLVVCEMSVRLSRVRDWHEVKFYESCSQQIRSERKCCFLVGSSRVAAAIDAEVFRAKLSESNHVPIPVYNFGKGYSTLVEHFLGIKYVARGRDGLHGVTVLIEAPVGFPEEATWTENWVRSEAPEIIVPYLRIDDLLNFWSIANDDGEIKSFITLAVGSSTIAHTKQIRKRLAKAIDQFFLRGAALAPEFGAGGIRVDAEGTAIVRAKALEMSRMDLQSQRPIVWDQTVVRSLVKLIQHDGGRVIFFEIPMSRVMTQSRSTALRLEDARNFQKKCKEWNTPFVHVPFSTSEDDFPDQLHLRPEKQDDFTKVLVETVRTFLSD